MERERAVERLDRLVETVESERMPVPVREIWVYGDLALGVDPVDRLDVYLTKDLLLGEAENDAADGATDTPDLDVEGIGETVRADWAAAHPESVRANEHGYVAPERCLAAHLVGDDEPIHLEVCNASFEDNVTRRLGGAQARDDYTEALDPRGVCLWVDGQRSADAFSKLADSNFAFPPLSAAFEMLGLEDDEAEAAARAVHDWREQQDGVTVRGDVV
jgi:hypothetical protein